MTAAAEQPPDPERSPLALLLTGWIVFAGFMMVLSGMYTIIWGFAAVVHDHVFLVSREGNVVDLSYTSWGWIQIVLGLVVFASGIGLVIGARWAVATTIAMALLSSLSHLLAISAYPLWSLMVIAFNVIVIYAVTVHGNDVRTLLGRPTPRGH